MTAASVIKILVGLVMLLAGGAMALTGMGYLGATSESTGWTIIGSIIAGFGVALGITVFQRR